jgi:hypothetical protein
VDVLGDREAVPVAAEEVEATDVLVELKSEVVVVANEAADPVREDVLIANDDDNDDVDAIVDI